MITLRIPGQDQSVVCQIWEDRSEFTCPGTTVFAGIFCSSCIPALCYLINSQQIHIVAMYSLGLKDMNSVGVIKLDFHFDMARHNSVQWDFNLLISLTSFFMDPS